MTIDLTKKFKIGDKVFITRSYADNPRLSWYKKGEILTIRRVDKELIAFEEYPNGAFAIHNDYLVKESDFVSAGELARLLYE